MKAMMKATRTPFLATEADPRHVPEASDGTTRTPPRVPLPDQPTFGRARRRGLACGTRAPESSTNFFPEIEEVGSSLDSLLGSMLLELVQPSPSQL